MSGFTTIPNNLAVPLFWLEFDRSGAVTGAFNQVSLLIGQTVSPLPRVPVLAGSVADIQAQAGAGSVLARMMVAYRKNDPVGEVWVLPIADNAAGVAATGTIMVAGPSTAAGVISLYVGGQLVSVPVALGTASPAIAIAIAAAVNAKTTLAATATVAASTVTLAAKNKGTLGNGIDIRHSYRGLASGEALPVGVALTITAMASGATDPDLADIENLLGIRPFDFICQPIAASGVLDVMRALMNETTGRWSFSQQLYGHVWTAKRDSAGNLLALAASRNDAHLTAIGMQPGLMRPADEVAAATKGACAQAIRASPNRPLQTVAVSGIEAPPVNQDWSFSDRQSLLDAGIALLTFGADGAASILRMPTTYRANPFGQRDDSLFDAEDMFLDMAIVRALRQRIELRYARSGLADDGTRFGPGEVIATPKSVKAELVAQYAELEARGLVEDAAGFASATIVQRDPTNRSRLNILYVPNRVNGLRVIAVRAQTRA